MFLSWSKFFVVCKAPSFSYCISRNIVVCYNTGHSTNICFLFLQVHIGSNIMVNQQLIDRMKLSAGNQATKFACNLVRVVFSPEELEESSLYGRVCNARKEEAPKKALGCPKLDAVICKSSSS